MQIVTASVRGQIVIPSKIRKQFNILPGKKLVVKIEGEHIVLTPMPDDPVESFCGIFEDKDSLTQELLRERRKERKREDKKSAG